MFGPIRERWFGEGERREIKERREEGKGKREKREKREKCRVDDISAFNDHFNNV